jgi:hypothetical protein
VPVSTTLQSREAILEALAGFLDELSRVLKDQNREALLQPASDGGWGVVEILPHLRDWEEIFLERAHLMVTEENPPLPVYDDDLWALERDYRGQDPYETLEDFRRLREEHVAFLTALQPEAWNRHGLHGHYGDITLQWLENHVREHDHEHLMQIKDALAA